MPWLRFQQGSNSHDVFGGYGLGRKSLLHCLHRVFMPVQVFVSRKLCDLMNGRIEVLPFSWVSAVRIPKTPHPRLKASTDRVPHSVFSYRPQLHQWGRNFLRTPGPSLKDGD